MHRTLIKNAEIITMNKNKDILIGDLLIEGNTIKHIGKDLQVENIDTFIDGTNKTIIPGFVQTHIHLCQTIFRDVMLPNQNGWTLLKEIRQISMCPVIMLTALDDVQDKLQGLHDGADDYITKPFIGDEVVARVPKVKQA